MLFRSIQKKTAALQEASMKLGEILYRKTQEKEAGTPDSQPSEAAEKSASSASADDVVDADFTNMKFEDDDKK